MSVFNKVYELISPKQKIIVGGSIPTFAYHQLLDKYNNLICCIGEGEESFLQLVNYFSYHNGKWELLKNIPNIAFIKDGKLFKIYRKPFALPSEKIIRRPNIINSIIETNGIIRIEASRGCSWRKCKFCCVNEKYAGSHWRPYVIEKIADELIDLSKMGIHSPYFTDEDFFENNPKRVKELAELILNFKHNKFISPRMDFFISIMAIDIISDEGKEALIALQKAGLREVFVGIESMLCRQLKDYNKLATAKRNKYAINFLKSLGLHVDVSYILFEPKLNIHELIKSIEYIDSLCLNNFDSRSIKRLRIQPCTEMSKEYNVIDSQLLDIDQLEYKYKFDDKKVGEVYTLYEIWEDECKEAIWKFQELTRGENISNNDLLKQKLSEIRAIDFDFLKLAIAYVVSNINKDEYISQTNKLRRNKFLVIAYFNKLLKR